MNAPSGAPNAYLFQEITYFEYTSTYESKITLTLMNGSNKVANSDRVEDVPVTAPIESNISSLGFTGTQLPANANGWILRGWYDSNGTKVLKADGSVVSGPISDNSTYKVEANTLTLFDDLTLHAVWLAPYTAYVKVNTLDAGDYVIAAGTRALVVNESAPNLTIKASDAYSDEGEPLTGVFEISNNTTSGVWAVSSNRGGYQLQNGDSYLIVNDSNKLSLSTNKSSSWALVGDKLQYNNKKGYYLQLNKNAWEATNGTGTSLTFYKEQTVYKITTASPNN